MWAARGVRAFFPKKFWNLDALKDNNFYLQLYHFMLITVFMTSCTRESWLCNFFLFEAKAEIRRLLPEGLQESISKVRSSVVRCYIAIYFLKKTIKSMYVKARIFLPLICFYYNILHFAIKHTHLSRRLKDKWYYTLWSYDHSNDPSGVCNLCHCPLGLAGSMAKFVWTSDAGINKWRQQSGPWSYESVNRYILCVYKF